MRPPVFVEGELPEDNVRTMNPPPVDRRKETEVAMRPSEPLAPPPGTGITPTPLRTGGTNPLVEESRTVHEAPVAVEPDRMPLRQSPTRISGPSFLGLSDGPVSSEYLLEEDAQEERSMGRSYLFLGLLLLFGVLIYKQWGAVAAFGRDLAHNTMPSAETSESQATTPAVRPPADESAAIPQKAEEKPESDHASATEEAAPSTTPQATEEDATKQETAPPESKATETEKSSAPAAAPVYDDSQIELAQKYLQGRGVAQDCNRGVSLLRSAAAQPNPKAQIKLGALYATGHCVSQDRAEAYRWFAQAHELQPSNQWIDKNLNSLWSEMTAEERARAQR